MKKWRTLSRLCMWVGLGCAWLSDSMDYSLPGSSIHRILQARILEWVAISFSRWSSRPRDQTRIFCIAGRFFTIWATREALTVTHLPPRILILSRSHSSPRNPHDSGEIDPLSNSRVDVYYRSSWASQLFAKDWLRNRSWHYSLHFMFWWLLLNEHFT